MEAQRVAGYCIRVIGGLAAALLATFAAGAWAATLVIAAAISLAGVVAALALTDEPVV